MSTGDMPQLSSNKYSNTTSGAAEWLASANIAGLKYGDNSKAYSEDVEAGFRFTGKESLDEIKKKLGLDEPPQPRRIQAAIQPQAAAQPAPVAKPQAKKEPPMPASRIVKVYIADPDTAVLLEDRVLYTGEEKLTDLTDQELFFEVPMAEILAKHNAKRTVTVDKKRSTPERLVYLEPTRIGALKMVVVSIAEF